MSSQALRSVRRAAACLVTVTALPAPLPVAAAVDVQLAVERSRGLYGEASPTHITSRTSTLRWRGERWLLQLELPWLVVRNAGGPAGLPDQPGSSEPGTQQGWGDAWAKVAWTAREFKAGQTGIDLVMKFKGANGSAARGLGSGARDWALQMDVVHQWGGVTAFGELGRRHTGDVPGARPFNDPWYAEVGAFVSPGPGVEVGLYHDARERIGRLGPLHETTVYGGWRLGQQRWQVHATHGHTPASVQRALGLSWRWRQP